VAELESSARRRVLARGLAAATGLFAAGCTRLTDTEWFPKVLDTAERLNYALARTLGRKSMAQEFTEADRSPEFRGNGTVNPRAESYRTLAAGDFADWRLVVDGLVETPLSLSLAELRAMPSRTQITRHDCVEGWSAIGKWTGTKLAAVLDAAKPGPGARFAMFHCADALDEAGLEFYYESIDLDDAYHVQTILAYELNGAPLPVTNGAPLRLRVERQLGYKHAKYLMRIELIESFATIRRGRGGYWPDRGYQWFAAI